MQPGFETVFERILNARWKSELSSVAALTALFADASHGFGLKSASQKAADWLFAASGD